MVEKAKIFYFSVFIFVVFAFVFHITAMGFPNWKKADIRNASSPYYSSVGSHINIGLFTRCSPILNANGQSCYPNIFANNNSCTYVSCSATDSSSSPCSCDYLPSTKGIAACTIIASIFLGLVIIILFIHSINTSETRSLGLFLGLFPLLLLLLAFIFILIALILVGSYLSRDIMTLMYQSALNQMRMF
jgi:hypothetical protein